MNDSLIIDARWLKTGIGRYTLALIRGLNEYASDLEITCIVHPEHAEMVSRYCKQVIVSKSKIYGVYEQLLLPWIARKYTTFYAPHYNIPIAWKNKLLVTVHDLNHLLDTNYRNTWKSRLYARQVLQFAVGRADVIIAPSLYTKQMLKEHLGAKDGRVVVIPCSIADCFLPIPKAEACAVIARDCGITAPYILYVGNLAPNKNIPLLLESFGRLLELRREGFCLVIVGESGKRRQMMEAYAESLHIEGSVIWLNNINDHLLAHIYSAAEMTIMPSLQEGFGLPVIESMACGTPVICSNTASLPEVAGDAALLFNPHSSEQLTESMIRLIDSTETRKNLIYRGLNRARTFSHEAFSCGQAAVVKKILSAS